MIILNYCPILGLKDFTISNPNISNNHIKQSYPSPVGSRAATLIKRIFRTQYKQTTKRPHTDGETR